MVLIAESIITRGAYESAIRRKRKAPPERGKALMRATKASRHIVLWLIGVIRLVVPAQSVCK